MYFWSKYFLSQVILLHPTSKCSSKIPTLDYVKMVTRKCVFTRRHQNLFGWHGKACPLGGLKMRVHSEAPKFGWLTRKSLSTRRTILAHWNALYFFIISYFQKVFLFEYSIILLPAYFIHLCKFINKTSFKHTKLEKFCLPRHGSLRLCKPGQ